jgi:16S rRNA (adenine1518-N6/adenine1519-N6)-dimethyltransferase
VTLTRREVADLMARYDLRPRKSLGQHFVVDPNTVRRIARLAGVGAGDHVVEIGAGLGSLTLALADTGADVIAVEIDRHLVPALREVAEPRGVTVVEGDARALDWNAVLGAGQWSLVANLPYNVATSLVLDLLEDVPKIERMLVMVQQEAGDRLAAAPGDDAYGGVSAKVAYWASAETVGRVPATVFLPPPNVESVLVRIERHRDGFVVPEDLRGRLFGLIDRGFATRRKMLRRALAGVVTPEGFAAAGIRPEARAEELSIADWARLLIACRSEPSPS